MTIKVTQNNIEFAARWVARGETKEDSGATQWRVSSQARRLGVFLLAHRESRERESRAR